ncbi:MAG TPA: YciI family protein [Pseudonocardiaceae bacterium]|nr:YciI family protein [Pseudonocardiaceae bacterium]
MMWVCFDPTAEPSPGGYTIDEWVAEMDARGVRLEGERLASPTDATVVRNRDGDVLVSDGPYAETKELLAGYDILDCVDLAEAIEVASKHPLARVGAMELQPFWED